MFIQDWIYFEKVVECKSITQASAELYRTYQGIYKSIARLEQEIGKPLFVRKNNYMLLTPFGKYVHENLAVPMLEYWESINDSAKSYDTYNEKKLRVSVFMATVSWLSEVHKALNDFIESRPDCNITLVRSSYLASIKGLENNELDIAMSIQQPSNEHLCRCLNFHRHYSLFVGKDHPLAGKSCVTLPDIEGYSLLFSNPDDISCHYLQSMDIDPNRFIFFSNRNPDYNRILRENFAIRFAADDTESVLNDQFGTYEGCVRIPFDPPIAFATSFMYKNQPVKKKLLLDLVRFLEDRFPEYA